MAPQGTPTCSKRGRTTLREIGFSGSELVGGSFSIVHPCIYQKNFAYFPITAHKGADFERMQVLLCHDGWIWKACDDYSMKDEDMFTDRYPQRNVIPFHVAGESQASRTLLSLRLSDIGFEQSRTFLRSPSSSAYNIHKFYISKGSFIVSKTCQQ